MQVLREGYNKATSQYEFYLQADRTTSVKVCQKAFRTYWGISNDRMTTLKKLADSGKVDTHSIEFTFHSRINSINSAEM